MKKIFSLVVALCLSGSVYAVGIGQDNNESSQDLQQNIKITYDDFADTLLLTNQQKEDMKQILKESGAKKTSLKKQMLNKCSALKLESSNENGDSFMIDSLKEDIENIKAEYSKVSTESKNRIKNVLNEEQYAEYIKLEQDKVQVVMPKAKSKEVLEQEKRMKETKAKLEAKAKKEQEKLEKAKAQAEAKAKKEQEKLEKIQAKAEAKAKKEQEKLENKIQEENLYEQF